ncbi:hypothetical protein Zmor_013743 [Zophobas morio]|uniref:Uncharacterized protein n=1 Tax=Zophobas morio TaxID=2755281 RepID=A0AA38IEL1_9CUCU|nr:hypothetical protein Zmor_013743 [Zophobas morio]
MHESNSGKKAIAGKQFHPNLISSEQVVRPLALSHEKVSAVYGRCLNRTFIRANISMQLRTTLNSGKNNRGNHGRLLETIREKFSLELMNTVCRESYILLMNMD